MQLELRPVPDSDLEAFFHLLNDESLAVHTGTIPHPITMDWAKERLFLKRAGEAEGTAVDRGLYLGGTLVGNAGWFIQDGMLEIAYAIHRGHRGKGLATKAAQLVLDMLHEAEYDQPIYATYFADNPGSGRVLEKLGFKYIETLLGTGASRVGEHKQYRMILDR